VAISPQACLEFAARHTWEASARAFVDTIANTMANVRTVDPETVDPEDNTASFASEQPGFVA
jgi:hypothetical protein